MHRWISMAIAIAVNLAGAAAAEPVDMSRLSWLEGRWTGTQDGMVLEEHWTSPAGGELVGMHKDVRNGRMVSFEFLRIGPGSGDSVCYFASPRGRPATPFCLTEIAERRVVFENRAHDFPQRILYWLDGTGRLHARVEGTIEGKLQGEEWVWSRSPGERTRSNRAGAPAQRGGR